MSEVIKLAERGFVTRVELEPSTVLTDATKVHFDSVVVIGFEADGTLYFASSEADGAQVLWLLEVTKLRLMQAANVIPTG
jgi:hypothetical protein